MVPRESFEVGTSRHAAVLVQDLDDRRRRLEAREPRQVTAGLGVTGTRQHATRLGHHGKDMPGLAEVLGPRVLGHRHAHRPGTVVGGDAGRDPLHRLDGDREIGGMALIRLGDHQRQAQLRAAVARHRQADQAAAVAGHVVDVLGSHEFGGHEQVAFVLATLVVHHDHHLAVAYVGDDVLDRTECGIRRARMQCGLVRHSRDLSGMLA